MFSFLESPGLAAGERTPLLEACMLEVLGGTGMDCWGINKFSMGVTHVDTAGYNPDVSSPKIEL